MIGDGRSASIIVNESDVRPSLPHSNKTKPLNDSYQLLE
jgi:hypothetical protein